MNVTNRDIKLYNSKFSPIDKHMYLGFYEIHHFVQMNVPYHNSQKN